MMIRRGSGLGFNRNDNIISCNIALDNGLMQYYSFRLTENQK